MKYGNKGDGEIFIRQVKCQILVGVNLNIGDCAYEPIFIEFLSIIPLFPPHYYSHQACTSQRASHNTSSKSSETSYPQPYLNLWKKSLAEDVWNGIFGKNRKFGVTQWFWLQILFVNCPLPPTANLTIK
jgi:hypothetical protein